MAIDVRLFHEVHDEEKRHHYSCDSCGGAVYAVLEIGVGLKLGAKNTYLCRGCTEGLGEDIDYLVHNEDPDGDYDTERDGDSPPYDAATATGMYDHY